MIPLRPKNLTEVSKHLDPRGPEESQRGLGNVAEFFSQCLRKLGFIG